LKITKQDVEHVARLARLRLSTQEKARFVRQLDQILAYVAKLEELDTANVEPTSHVLPLRNVFREDRVGKSLSVKKVLDNAPAEAKGYFRVPKIIE